MVKRHKVVLELIDLIKALRKGEEWSYFQFGVTV